jgi:signal peptidase II
LSPAVLAWSRALGLGGIVVALDQVSKQLAEGALAPGERIGLGLGFELVDERNRGIAFGLLESGEELVVVATVAALALILGYFAVRPLQPGLWIAVGLLAGGALGNLADRARAGAVTDFLDPPAWPAFNLADVAIVAGVVALALAHATPTKIGR